MMNEASANQSIGLLRRKRTRVALVVKWLKTGVARRCWHWSCYASLPLCEQCHTVTYPTPAEDTVMRRVRHCDELTML